MTELRKEYFEDLTKKCGAVLKTLQAKGSDYVDRTSDNPFENYELAADVTGIATEQVMISRVVEKLTRAANLIKLDQENQTPAVNESLEDTLKDSVGILLMCWEYVDSTRETVDQTEKSVEKSQVLEQSPDFISRIFGKK